MIVLDFGMCFQSNYNIDELNILVLLHFFYVKYVLYFIVNFAWGMLSINGDMTKVLTFIHLFSFH